MRFNKLLLIPALAIVLPLGACDGLEFQMVTKMGPYGTRTAGSGPAYVLAKMMPKKDMNLEPVERNMEATPVQEKALNDMREMFRDKQRK